MDNNFQKIIFQEIVDFFKPIVDTQGNHQEIIQLFEECGWDINSVLGGNENGFINSIAAIIDLLGGIKDVIENPPDSLQELMDALGNVAPLFNGIKNIADGSVISNITQAPRISELPEDAIHFILSRYLYRKSPFLYRFLELVGIISIKSGDSVLLNGTIIHIPSNSVHFYFESLGDLFSDPAKYFKGLYLTDGIADIPAANKVAANLFPKIANLLAVLNINSFIGRGICPDELTPKEEERLKGLMTLSFPYYSAETNTSGNVDVSLGLLPEDEDGPGIFVVPSGAIAINISIEDWILSFLASAQIDGFSITKNGFNIYKGTEDLTQFTADLSLLKKRDGSSKALLIGGVDSTRFEIGKIEFGGGVSITSTKQEFRLFVDLNECAIVIAASEGDTFLKTILGEEGINVGFNLKVCWSSLSGFHIEGSGGLEISLPTHISLGPIEIQNAIIALKPDKGNLPLELSASLKGALGPISIVVESMGLKIITSFPSGGGNVGPLDFQAGFKPPSAIGLSLDTPAVKAGGFLSIKPDEYIGAIEIEIKSIQLAIKAIAIINTKLPGGEEGFSLLVIITAEFAPIQLSFGFTLNGIGGLFGYKRTFESDELRRGLQNKTLDSILFPKNVIANITNIVGDLKKVFPMGHNFLIGPMVKIGWGSSLVTAEIGILIQIPEPVVIAILGVVRLQLPEPKNVIVKLQIDFLGIIDFEKKLLSIDATLTDSRILTMTLTGQFALRIGWGATPVFIFSSGGFHPDFKEAPVELQHMERLGLVIINEKDVKLGVDTYFALTTNTVQIGAHARFRAKSGDFIAVAEVGFDALIQFNPFFFQISIHLTGRITGPLIDVAIDVRGNLSGPNVWHVWGYVSATILGVALKIPFDHTFGDPIEELSAGLEDVLLLLTPEISKSTNWKTTTVINGASSVSLREITPGPDEMIVHPNTVLSFNQRVVPLEVSIDKFGNKGVEVPKHFSISDIWILDNGAPRFQATFVKSLDDSFAPGNFFEIAHDQKLSRPSFEQMKSGKEFTLGSSESVKGKPVTKPIDYEVMYIRKKKTAKKEDISLLEPNQVVLLASGGAAAKSKRSVENTRVSCQAPPQITINRPGYIVANKADRKQVVGTEEYGNQAEAYNKRLAFDENETLVLSTYEEMKP